MKKKKRKVNARKYTKRKYTKRRVPKRRYTKRKKYGGGYIAYENKGEDACRIDIDTVDFPESRWPEFLFGPSREKLMQENITANNEENCIIHKVRLEDGNKMITINGHNQEWSPELLTKDKYKYAIPVPLGQSLPTLHYMKENGNTCFAVNEEDTTYHTHDERIIHASPGMSADGLQWTRRGNELEARPVFHPCLVDGSEVIMAGEINITIEEGRKIYTISNESGHYKPAWTDDLIALMEDFFEGKEIVIEDFAHR